ncbi:MAG: DUF3786 domain-containing protein [Eubacteriales bacterium]|nr:DUF3786 domain-containing protein [Eubacteriales bacterium]
MLIPAKERLKYRPPEDIAKKSGSLFCKENSVIALQSLNQEVRISLPEYNFYPRIEEWRQLVILHYLDMADGVEVSAQIIPFGELKSGLIRGTKFDHDTEKELRTFLKGKTPERIRQICGSLGAEFVDSNADLCAVFPFLPNYPVWLKIWFADEEFEASDKFYLSKSADHYLTIEDAVTVGEILLAKLKKEPIKNGNDEE